MPPSHEKNQADSVRRRLLNGARERGDNFNFVLTRYAIERFLYRLGASPQNERFVLKGAALYNLWANQNSDLTYRATRDLDLWGNGSPAVEGILETIRAVLQTPVPDDGIEFLPASLQGQPMRQDQDYEGCRVTVEARLAGAKIKVQIDFGFGDAITPGAQFVKYPTLLPDSPAPRLKAYPRETVIAEKFEALVSLALLNTRLKDFFDLWMLCRHFEYEGEILRRALQATFAQRQTALPTEIPVALTAAFFADPLKVSAWNSFGKRSEIPELPALEAVAAQLKEFLMPVVAVALSHPQQEWPFQWSPASGWHA